MSEYKNAFHSIQLHINFETWLISPSAATRTCNNFVMDIILLIIIWSSSLYIFINRKLIVHTIQIQT